MLQQLHIENYAIIDEIDISFDAHLNIITGETGAGKSIIMGALSLILGDRAESTVLHDKNRKCVVEGTFSTDQKETRAFLRQHELDEAEDILIRREIAPNGKSRAFVNDTPVPLNVLKELASLLVDLHQQFDTLRLGDSDFQREVIDALAGNFPSLEEYRTLYKQFLSAKKLLDKLKQQQAASNKEADYHSFLFQELEEAALKPNEIEEAEASIKLMSNAESIKSTLEGVYGQLEEGEQPVVQQLKVLINELRHIQNFHQDIDTISERLRSSQVELQDIAGEIDRLNRSVTFDAEKMNHLNERISTGYKLMKKHGVSSTAALLEIQQDLQQKLDSAANITDSIKKAEEQTDKLHKVILGAAKDLSKNRKKQLPPFEEKVNALLSRVGMPNARIKANLQQDQQADANGTDSIELLFDANNTSRFEPLRKVASGGELSRLMLVIKSLVAKSIQLSTLIFDEIDTGISGEAARQVGIVLKDLSVAHQVISITHQPQIAAKASAHLFIYKEIKGNRINTAVKLLNGDERITTIAKMLSGEKPTAAAFENAREMIGN